MRHLRQRCRVAPVPGHMNPTLGNILRPALVFAVLGCKLQDPASTFPGVEYARELLVLRRLMGTPRTPGQCPRRKFPCRDLLYCLSTDRKIFLIKPPSLSVVLRHRFSRMDSPLPWNGSFELRECQGSVNPSRFRLSPREESG